LYLVGAPASPAHAAAADTPWTVYHGNALGSGADTSGVTFSPATHAWTSPVLDGQLYGEPLELGGRVFVATENDTMYALAADSGAVLWSAHVGTPVPSTDLPCGNIAPTVGITGTPVVDAARSEIFAVADEMVNGAPAHRLLGWNIFTGATMLDEAADPPGQSVPAILQRTGLNLSDGDVVFGYGGNDGDCSTYHGWVVSVPEGGGPARLYDTTGSVANGTRGAVWMGGAAPEVDAAGNVWAAIGNGSTSSPYDSSDSVIELSPQLALKQLFAPSNWSAQNAGDQDLGSAGPALLPDGAVFQAGKSHTGYLLSQAALGGIGGQLASATVCSGSTSDGGDAVSGSVVYVPCMSGLEAVQTNASPSSINVMWTAASVAPPITAGGLVWSIRGGTLFGLNPSNGSTVQQLSVGGEANHFPTPSVGDSLLLAPSTDQVYAFSGSAGLPGPPSPPPPPTTTVLLPSAGATVSGGAWLDAAGSSPAGVASVTFDVSGGAVSNQVVGTGTPTLYGWIGGWDTTDVPNGTYTLHSVAVDALGHSTTSAGVIVTVDNLPLRTTVIIPSNGTTLSGSSAVLDATASGTNDITGVQFEVTGGTVSNRVVGTATLTMYGWIARWNTTGIANGTYTLQSVATEVGGTTATSPGITVTVHN
jgi:hypothetical protein